MDSRQQKYERKKMNKKRARASSDQLDKFDSLAWNSSLSQDDDTFSRFVGSNELEGGFLSLEEIDEVSYGLEIPKFDKETKATDEKFEEGEEKKGIKQKKKNKTRKQKNKDKKNIESKESETKDSNGGVNEKFKVKEVEKKKNNTKKSKNKNTNVKTPENNTESAEKDDTEQDSIDETEYYAWNELRLHPMIMKSIYKLKFKEPTPIQKACIPAAAHQGKDVIGAAETGSGKTLAFGLPILHRLLQEREKDEKSSSKGYLRALIVTPTRELAAQVTDHLKQVCKDMDIKVVSIFGGMSSEKQERLLKLKPEIVVGTPGRLWELMSNGDNHLISLQFLSFFILDEADRMIETGHFRELQSIIDMLPVTNGLIEGQNLKNSENCVTVSNLQRKKRQTFVFSATIALSGDFRKKLKRGKNNNKSDEINSIEALSERAGMRENVAIVDLTNASIMANKLEESFLECKEEDKDAYLYYILSVHGQGRTIVFCTSIAALRHISSILRILGINVWTLHAQMQQRARLKAMDRFKGNDNGILIATDVAARGLDIPGVRTVVHYQLPHSAEVYVHRSGRTARAFSDGCSIALISPNDTSKFASLCKTFSKESFQRFPVELSYMPEVMKRLSLARQIDKITRKGSQDKAKKTWFEQNAESIGLDIEEIDSEEEKASECKLKKATSAQLNKLLQELKNLLSRPLQPKSLSNRFLAGAGVSPMLQLQIMELSRQKVGDVIDSGGNKRRKLMVIGQDCVEPLQALRSAGNEARTDLKVISENRKSMVDLKRKRQQEKKRVKEQRRKQKKKMQMDKLNSS